MNVKKILFPTDFSDCSRQAMDHALFFARDLDAELHALHAVVLHQADPADPDHRFETGPELLDHLMKTAESELGRIGQHVGGAVKVRQVHRRGFSPSVVILEYAEEIGADLIVMGTHGYRGPKRFFLGSVATEVVRHSDCPVLTLRVQEDTRALEAIERILVPVDFSDQTATAVENAAALASRFGSAVHLLHVVDAPPLPAFYGPVPDVGTAERLRKLATDELDDLGGEKLEGSVEWTASVREGQAWREIVRAAEADGSDLIVIPTHGHGALDRLLLGSTTERVLRAADCPVMTLRPGVSLV